MLQFPPAPSDQRIKIIALASIAALLVALALLERPREDAGAVATAGVAAPSSEALAAPTAAVAAPVPEPPPAIDERHEYREALRAREAGDHAAAAAAFDRVRRQVGVLYPLATLREAQTLMLAQRPAEAVQSFTLAAADASLPIDLRLTAIREGSTAAVETGQVEAARQLIARLDEAIAPGTAEASRAHWHGARLLRALGDAQWTARALAAVSEAPASSSAREALDGLEQAGVPVPTLTAALVRYRAGDHRRAAAAYRWLVNQPVPASDAAQAWFYLGAVAERASDPAGAVEAYSNSLAHAPGGQFAADAYWWRGQLLAQDGQLAAATADFDALARDFPRSPFADDAVLKAALLAHEQGNDEEAARRLRSIIESRPAVEAAAASRWLGSLGLRGSDDATASAYAPLSFAALLEQAGPEAMTSLPPDALGEWNTTPTDWAPVGAWMSRYFGEPGPGASRNHGSWIRLASAMSDVGETEAARVAWTSSLSAVRNDPHGALEVARLASESGFHDLALTAAGYVLRPLSQGERASAPLALLRLAYPAPFPQAVESAAATEGVPPLLLLALTRQESIFNPRARSSAGALGLTQVMPETGKSIAASLKTEWRLESLHEPSVSLRFGAHYLSQQLRRYQGNVLAALAAYNAGPGSADRWMRKSGGDVNGFLQAVEYAETQLYIERVLENYAHYRFVYGFASRPSIR